MEIRKSFRNVYGETRKNGLSEESAFEVIIGGIVGEGIFLEKPFLSSPRLLLV